MTAALLHRSCPLCHADRPAPHVAKGDLRLARCAGCSMVYADPVPPEMVSGEYYDREGRGYYLSPAKLESDYADVRFQREMAFFRQHCASGVVLDVGCSSGAFLYQLGKRFPGDYELLGTDVSGPPLDYAESRGVPVVRGDFLRHEFGGRKFKAITFWAVLEHLAEPDRFLERAWSLLEPGGVCFVLVPNMRSLAARALGPRYRYIYEQHLNYFTKATLSRLVERRFAIIAIGSSHFNPVVIWQDWRRGGTAISNQERAELLKRTTRYKQSPWLGPVRLGYRSVERVLASLFLADNLILAARR